MSSCDTGSRGISCPIGGHVLRGRHKTTAGGGSWCGGERGASQPGRRRARLDRQQVAQCDSMVAVAPRLRLESALGQTGTTVTAFLEQLVGEPVDAYERRHVMIKAGTPTSWVLGEGHPLLRRSPCCREEGRRCRTCTPRACSSRAVSLPPSACNSRPPASDRANPRQGGDRLHPVSTSPS